MDYRCKARPKPGGIPGGRLCKAGLRCTLQVSERLNWKKRLPRAHKTTGGPVATYSHRQALGI